MGRHVANPDAPDELTANIKFAPDEQALKCAVAPDVFSALDNAWGRRAGHARRLRLYAKPNSRPALEMAWRHAVPKAKPKRR